MFNPVLSAVRAHWLLSHTTLLPLVMNWKFVGTTELIFSLLFIIKMGSLWTYKLEENYTAVSRKKQASRTKGVNEVEMKGITSVASIPLCLH